jgi:hypothetical protein
MRVVGKVIKNRETPLQLSIFLLNNILAEGCLKLKISFGCLLCDCLRRPISMPVPSPMTDEIALFTTHTFLSADQIAKLFAIVEGVGNRSGHMALNIPDSRSN